MSGEQHLGWEALERIRTDEASADEFAHLATCAACREALADLERLASRFKESLSAEPDAIPAAREDAILSAARERAAAIAAKKLVRLPWWKQRSALALAASLMVAGSAAYLTYLTRNEPSPRPLASEAARSPAADLPSRTNEEVRQKKEVGRLEDEARPPETQAIGRLQKTTPGGVRPQLAEPKAEPTPEPPRPVGLERSDAKGDAAASKDANLALRDLAAAPAPAASNLTAAPSSPAARAPALEPAKPERAPVAAAAGGAVAGATGPSEQAAAPPAEADDKLAAALSAHDDGQQRRLTWLPPRTGLWAMGQGEQRDLTTPHPLQLVSTEIEVRVGDTVARRVRQRFANPSGQPIVATYSIGLAPGERSGDVSLTIGTTEVAPQPAADMTDVRVWQDLPIAGVTIDLTTLSPPRPLEGVASGSVRIRIPVPPPPPQSTEEPPTLAIRLEPARGFRIGQPAAAGLAITGHPLGSGAWDLTLPPSLGVKEDLLELDVPIVKSGD